MKKSICILLFFLIAGVACNQDEGFINYEENQNLNEADFKSGHKKDKVSVYHYDKDSDSWKVITISSNALPAHLKQGGYLATYVPDDNFEQALIDLSYDTPPLDDYVRTVNINSVTSLGIANLNINDLTGIEDFSNLDVLRCQKNQLTSLDVSKNTSLTELLCYDNQLTRLNISDNKVLTALGCNINQLTSLDVSNCTKLISLRCKNNQLTNLDLSKNTCLELLQCTGNPNLTCIQVRTLPVPFIYYIDLWSSFSLDCN